MASYRSSDIFTFLDEAQVIDPDGIFVAFLPPNQGYSAMYKRLDAIFSWEQPACVALDAERKAKLIEKIRTFDHVMIDDAAGDTAPVMLKRKAGNKQIWLYSNLDLKRILVKAHPKSIPTNYVLLEDADVEKISLKSSVVIKRVKTAEINYYRNLYLAKGIEFTDGMWNFLFFIDGKLLGFAILTLPKFGDTGLYMLSDFAVPAAKDSRFAKLVLYLLQSTHFQAVCEELVMARVPTLTTTAFTDKPVSVKYRSCGFELMKRGQHDQGGKKFLNYDTKTGLHTDVEALDKWLRGKAKSVKAKKKAKQAENAAESASE
jgi:hypothetical protein